MCRSTGGEIGRWIERQLCSKAAEKDLLKAQRVQIPCPSSHQLAQQGCQGPAPTQGRHCNMCRTLQCKEILKRCAMLPG